MVVSIIAILSCNKIYKSYVTNPILEDISFLLNENDKVGLVGVNGSGKTTLFNVLTGHTDMDEGNIYKSKDVTVGYLEQHIQMSGENTIFDECVGVFEGLLMMEKEIRTLEKEMEGCGEDSQELEKIMERYARLSEEFADKNGYAINSEIRGMLIGLGFEESEFSKSIGQLSGGQKSRLLLAKLLLQKPDLLLLDEPTNHLDLKGIEFLEQFLKDFRGAVIVISHDRYFLNSFVNKIFLLEHRKLRVYRMNYTRFMHQRKIDLENAGREYENQQKEIKRQEEIIQRFANYGGSRYIKQSQSRQKLLDKMKLVERPQGNNKKMILRFEPKVESGKDVLQVENLSKSFGEQRLFKDVSFDIYRGEKVGLIGANGVGKTTLFKIVLGKLKADEGKIRLGTQVRKGYFDQEQETLNYDNTVIDEIWDDHPEFTHYDLRSVLAKFMFTGDDIFKDVADLSGGEKGRVSLLKLMLSDANFLLMDEPTNHLDIDSKEVLEDALLAYMGTCFIISHDRYFLNKTIDRLLVLEEEGITEYPGNYDYYQEKIREVNLEPEEIAGATKTQIQKDKKKTREQQRELKQWVQRSKELQKEIDDVEQEIDRLKEKSYEQETYEDHTVATALFSSIRDLAERREELYEAWMEVEENIENFQ